MRNLLLSVLLIILPLIAYSDWDNTQPVNTDNLATSAPLLKANFQAIDGTSGTPPTSLSAGTGIVLEGATADAFETTITVTDPTADNTFTIPNASGTAVITASDQTIAGTKTFSTIPVLPASDPTTDNQAARKSYVDDLTDAIGEVTFYDYSTSASSYTARDSEDMYMAFGKIVVSGNSDTTISSLPFGSTSAYFVVSSFSGNTSANEELVIEKLTGASFKIHNNDDVQQYVDWLAIGY